MTTASRWPEVALGELIDEAKPGFASGHDLDEGVFQFRMNNLTRDCRLDFTKRRRVPADSRKLSSYLLEPGDVIFNATNSPDLVGKSAYFNGLEEPVAFSNHFLRLRPTKAHLDGRFLARWLHLQHQRRVFQTRARQWVNQATFDRDSLLGLAIPLPPIEEQRRIAAILDQADELRAKRRASLALLESLTESIFLDMFGDPTTNPHGWPVARLGSLVREDDRINYGVVQPGEHVDGGVPMVRVSDLRHGSVQHENLKRIAPSIEAKYARSRLLGDEVLMSCVGSTGIVAVASPREGGFNVARAVARVSVRSDLSPRYIAAFLSTGHAQRYFTRELRTVAQPTLNIKQLAAFSVVVPPVTLQQQFEHLVLTTGDESDRLAIAAEELNGLFASLQQRAFSGQL